MKFKQFTLGSIFQTTYNGERERKKKKKKKKKKP